MTVNVRITPRPLRGRIAAVPSKSELHRLLICSALANAPTELPLPFISGDIAATLRCLGALGAEIELSAGTVRIVPICARRARERADDIRIDCGESGSTLRFLLPAAAALGGRFFFTGGGRLPERPLAELLSALGAHGVTFSSETLPLVMAGRLRPGVFTLPGDVSSQYVTGLLLALPLLAGDSRVCLASPLQSAGYVEITLAALRRFGVVLTARPDGWDVPGGQTFCSPGRAAAEGDWSAAAFFLAAGALGGPVTVTGLRGDSLQGDRAVADILRRFGADVRQEGGSVTVRGGRLRGCTVELSDIPDLLPPLAAVAAAAEGETRFTGGARLRQKESDRLASAAAMLRALGAKVRELPDGLVVTGGALPGKGPAGERAPGKSLPGGAVLSFHDHRVAMAAAAAALCCRGPVTITDAEAVAKSYPSFFTDYTSLGGAVDVL